MVVMSFLGFGLLGSVSFVSSEYDKIKNRESESENGGGDDNIKEDVKKVGGTLNQRMRKNERSD